MIEKAEDYFTKSSKVYDLQRAIELNDAMSIYSMMEDYADSQHTQPKAVEGAEEFLKKEGVKVSSELLSNHYDELLDIMEQYASQGEKEEGWVIVDKRGCVNWITLCEDMDSCILEFCKSSLAMGQSFKKSGYKCVRAERTYKLIEG